VNKPRYNNHSLGQITKDLLFNNTGIENRFVGGDILEGNYDSRSFNRKNKYEYE